MLPVGKTIRWIEKWMTPFMMGTRSSITVGKIVQRAPAVGAKMWCLFFVTLQGWRAVRSTVTYFEQVLCRGLWVGFDVAYILFQH